MKRFSRRAVTALFIERQHLDRPRGRRLTAKSLERFVTDAGGLQLDSINVVERAHYLTTWSRFGPYDRSALDRLVYRRRILFEYWAHAACLVPMGHLIAWRRAMADYQIRHTGWASWLRKNGRVLAAVEDEIRARGPLSNADFRWERPRKGAGWWNWKPAAHALHYLWMTGRIAVATRQHFQKRFDLTERVVPGLAADEPLSREEFARWHIERSLHAMGAATPLDLSRYLSFPRTPVPERKRALESLLREGRVVEVEVDGAPGRWLALAEDLPALAAAGRRRAAARGTTLLGPFDSLLWHRERVSQLFGFDYRIEVYVPGPKRTHGYYAMPIYHDGLLLGRVDAKNHRAEARLEVKRVHLEPWLARGKAPQAAHWGAPDPERVVSGVADALRSLATFAGASQVTLGRVEPPTWKRRLAKALDEAAG